MPDPLELGLSRRPLMVLLAGANGSGKSTLYDLVIRPRLPTTLFINADRIQRDVLKDSRPEASYRAARLADDHRNACMKAGRSFVTETVFSHPSKLELVESARAAGHTVVLVHIGLDSEDRNAARVALRVKRGGHAVPVDKIRARRERGAPLISAAARQVDFAYVYDNSVLGRAPLLGVSGQGGHLRPEPGMTDWQRELYGL